MPGTGPLSPACRANAMCPCSGQPRPATTQSRSQSTTAVSDEGADTGDGAADDERVDLPGALVGVDRLAVGDEPAHLVLQQDAVAAEQLAGVADRLAHPHGAKGLGQRRMVVFRGARLLKLGEPGAQAR